MHAIDANLAVPSRSSSPKRLSTLRLMSKWCRSSAHESAVASAGSSLASRCTSRVLARVPASTPFCRPCSLSTQPCSAPAGLLTFAESHLPAAGGYSNLSLSSTESAAHRGFGGLSSSPVCQECLKARLGSAVLDSARSAEPESAKPSEADEEVEAVRLVEAPVRENYALGRCDEACDAWRQLERRRPKPGKSVGCQATEEMAKSEGSLFRDVQMTLGSGLCLEPGHLPPISELRCPSRLPQPLRSDGSRRSEDETEDVCHGTLGQAWRDEAQSDGRLYALRSETSRPLAMSVWLTAILSEGPM
ncbi:unnamed protein product [Protopolystoma xenopodis]|uniref:Uncharacterized protein n=1 Tax=Protopolystoma xenopodis TaxID=117903 RepID=A0A448X3M2_9PLAT|nr:unnamed protein product [Protopolystoma xenopodis]